MQCNSDPHTEMAFLEHDASSQAISCFIEFLCEEVSRRAGQSCQVDRYAK